jgi:hypothetical protein
MGQDRISVTPQFKSKKICMLYTLITLLYYGVLVYCTYSMMVVERCLPAERWGMTLAINVSEDMLNNQG